MKSLKLLANIASANFKKDKELAILKNYVQKTFINDGNYDRSRCVDYTFSELMAVFDGNFTHCWQFVKTEQRKTENLKFSVLLLSLLWKIELEANYVSS
jgi:hypothetical protein